MRCVHLLLEGRRCQVHIHAAHPESPKSLSHYLQTMHPLIPLTSSAAGIAGGTAAAGGVPKPAGPGSDRGPPVGPRCLEQSTPSSGPFSEVAKVSEQHFGWQCSMAVLSVGECTYLSCSNGECAPWGLSGTVTEIELDLRPCTDLHLVQNSRPAGLGI